MNTRNKTASAEHEPKAKKAGRPIVEKVNSDDENKDNTSNFPSIPRTFGGLDNSSNTFRRIQMNDLKDSFESTLRRPLPEFRRPVTSEDLDNLTREARKTFENIYSSGIPPLLPPHNSRTLDEIFSKVKYYPNLERQIAGFFPETAPPTPIQRTVAGDYPEIAPSTPVQRTISGFSLPPSLAPKKTSVKRLFVEDENPHVAKFYNDIMSLRRENRERYLKSSKYHSEQSLNAYDEYIRVQKLLDDIQTSFDALSDNN
jgi:hypothetical protein